MAKRKSFEDWKAEVNKAVIKLVGIDCDCLPDYAYWHAYAERKLSPSKTAKEVVSAAKTF